MKALVKSNSFLSTIVVAIFLNVIFGHFSIAQAALTKIADNVYGYVDVKPFSPQNSFAANSGVIIGNDGIVVIDTLVSAKEAQRLIKDIRLISQKPIKYVINTHFHLDHVLGNSEFAKLGAIVISHTLEKEYAQKNGEAMLKNISKYGLSPKEMEGTTLSRPTISFNDRLEIDLGNQKIELSYPGASHTDGSILVYLPDKKILFAGDILFTGYHPFMADGNIPGWVGVLDAIPMMDVNQIIPGHGPISSKKDIDDMKNYLVLFDENARSLAAKSQDPEFIFSELKKILPPREGDPLIKANIQFKYISK